MKTLLAAGLVVAGLFPAVPALAQSIDIGPGGIRVDPRSPREREYDAIRREELREERRDAIRDDIRREERRRDFEDGVPPRGRY